MSKRFFLALMFCLSLAFGVCLAGEPSITAEVDRNKCGKGDPIVLTVVLNDIEGEPRIESNGDFEVAGRSVYSSTEIVNFSVSIKKTYTYTLIPLSEGHLTTPEVSVEDRGKIFKAPRPSVEVSSKYSGGYSGGSSSQGGSIFSGSIFGDEDDEDSPAGIMRRAKKLQERLESLNRSISRPRAGSRSSSGFPFMFPSELKPFIKSEISTEKAYVNQQVLLKIDVYMPDDYEGALRLIPSVNEGVIVQQVEPVQEMPFSEGGVSMTIHRISVALYPMKAGHYDIKPFKVNWQSPVGGFRVLETDSFEFEVSELPHPAPSNFCGGVGDFTLRAECNTASAVVSKPFTVSLIAEGVGNASSVVIEPPEIKNADRFDSSDSIRREASGDVVKETKQLKTTFVPSKSGVLEIPPVSLSFFSPEKGAYYSLSTEPLSVSSVGNAAPSHGVADSSDAGSRSGVLSHSLKTSMSAGNGKGLVSNPFAVSVAVSPFVLFVFLTVFGRLSGVLKGGGKNSSGKAMAGLRASLKRLGDDDYSALSEAFFSYLAVRLGLDKGVTVKSLSAEAEKSAGADMAARIASVFTACDQARFTSGGHDDGEIGRLSSECLSIGEELEKILRREK